MSDNKINFSIDYSTDLANSVISSAEENRLEYIDDLQRETKFNRLISVASLIVSVLTLIVSLVTLLHSILL